MHNINDTVAMERFMEARPDVPYCETVPGGFGVIVVIGGDEYAGIGATLEAAYHNAIAQRGAELMAIKETQDALSRPPNEIASSMDELFDVINRGHRRFVRGM